MIDPPQSTSPIFLRRSSESLQVWLVQIFAALLFHMLLMFGVRIMWADIVVETPDSGPIDFVEVGVVDEPGPDVVVASPPLTTPTAPVAPPPVPVESIAQPAQPDQTEVIAAVPLTTPVKETPSPSPSPQPATPQPVTPQPATPQPVMPQPVTPQPVTPQPVTPQPATPQPVGPAGSNIKLPERPATQQSRIDRGIPGATPGTTPGGSASFSFQNLVPIPCQSGCQHLSYTLIQPPKEPVKLLITSAGAALPPGAIVVDVTFEVEAQAGQVAILAKNGEFGVRVSEAKLTPEQQNNLNEAARSLLEQCQFKLEFDATYSPTIGRATNYVLDAQIKIQII